MAAPVGESRGIDPAGVCRGRLASRTACGEILQAQATVFLGELNPEDVRLEFYLGLVDPGVELGGGASVTVEPKQSFGGAAAGFSGVEVMCEMSGVRGYTAGVLPKHNDLVTMCQPGYTRRAG